MLGGVMDRELVVFCYARLDRVIVQGGRGSVHGRMGWFEQDGVDSVNFGSERCFGLILRLGLGHMVQESFALWHS